MTKIRFLLVSVTLMVYIFLMHFFGQKIIDENDRLFSSAYTDSQWYLLSPKLRGMIYLIMLRSSKRTAIRSAGMLDTSLEQSGKVILDICFKIFDEITVICTLSFFFFSWLNLQYLIWRLQIPYSQIMVGIRASSVIIYSFCKLDVSFNGSWK